MAIIEAAQVSGGTVVNRSKFDDENPLPSGWVPCDASVGIGWTDNGDGTFSPPAQSPPDALDQLEIRDNLLRNLAHDFGDGRVIQVRPHPLFGDESNIRNALEIMARKSQTSRSWFDINNTSITVTVAELQAALESGQDQGDQIWTDYHNGLL